MDERVWVTAKKHEAKKQKSGFDTRKTDFSESISSPIDHVLSLQRTIGNQAVQRLFKSGVIQAKLRIGQPGDIYEQEADRVAEQVMRMPEPQVERQPKKEEEELIQTKPLAEQITPLVQRQVEPEEDEEEEEPVQTKQTGGQAPQVSPSLEAQIQSLKGRGKPLPESDRAFFEPRFGYDFSQVRVHMDERAAESARTVNAQAFTIGQDVVFGAGQYAPDTTKGKRLLAHELTHVVQQTASVPTGRRKSSVIRKDGCPDVHLMRRTFSPNRLIQRRSTQQICKGLKDFQVSVPSIVSSSGTAGSRTLGLGPFSCIPGKCQITNGVQVMTVANVRSYYSTLIKAVNFSKKLIKQISRYCNTVSATATYKQFLKWLHRISGVKPKKLGVTPKAAVAAETTAFISPANILRQWSKLGKIQTFPGTWECHKTIIQH